MHAKNRSAFWFLGFSVGFIGTAVLLRRRSKLDVAPESPANALLGKDTAGPAPVQWRGSISDSEALSDQAEAEPTATVQVAIEEPPGATLEPRLDGRPWSPHQLFRRMRPTNLIIAACMVVLAFTAVYYVVKSAEYRREGHRLMTSMPALPSGVAEWTESVQRPWVGLPRPTVYPLTRAGGGFAIKLQNFGKTPALNVRIADYVKIEDPGQLTGMQDVDGSPPLAAGTLMPDDRFDTNVWFKTSPDAISSLAQGRVLAVNYALVTYEDILHNKHATRSCFYWHGGLSTPLPCDRFNTVD